MDTVRFGRALGMGARQAAKTLVTAVDAARAPHPSTTRPVAPRSQEAKAEAVASLPAQTTAASVLRARLGSATKAGQHAPMTGRGLVEGSRRFGRAVWAPAVRVSGVLWLELTGVFFALFALIAGIAVWKLRGALRLTPETTDQHTHLLFAAGMVLVFGYFSLSSFVRAGRRGRLP